MTSKTDYTRAREARYLADGFTLMEDAKPEIGKPVEAVRVFQPRGFGGVILRTEYKIVPIIRESEFRYTDTLNKDTHLTSIELEAWRELQTYAPAPVQSSEPGFHHSGDSL